MTVQIIGDVPGFTIEPAAGTNSTLYRFELIDGALTRERLRDVRPHPDRNRDFIDVLVNEDRFGRYICGMRGFVVPRQGSAVGEHPPFRVGADLMLAIGDVLDVDLRMRHPPRLAALRERHVG